MSKPSFALTHIGVNHPQPKRLVELRFLAEDRNQPDTYYTEIREGRRSILHDRSFADRLVSDYAYFALPEPIQLDPERLQLPHLAPDKSIWLAKPQDPDADDGKLMIGHMGSYDMAYLKHLIECRAIAGFTEDFSPASWRRWIAHAITVCALNERTPYSTERVASIYWALEDPATKQSFVEGLIDAAHEAFQKAINLLGGEEPAAHGLDVVSAYLETIAQLPTEAIPPKGRRLIERLIRFNQAIDGARINLAESLYIQTSKRLDDTVIETALGKVETVHHVMWELIERLGLEAVRRYLALMLQTCQQHDLVDRHLIEHWLARLQRRFKDEPRTLKESLRVVQNQLKQTPDPNHVFQLLVEEP